MASLAAFSFWITFLMVSICIALLTYIVAEGNRRIDSLSKTAYKVPEITVDEAVQIAQQHLGTQPPDRKAIDNTGEDLSIHKVYWMKIPRQGILLFDEYKAGDRAWYWNDQEKQPNKQLAAITPLKLRTPPVLQKIGTYGKPLPASTVPETVKRQDVIAELAIGNRYMYLTDELDQNWGMYLVKRG